MSDNQASHVVTSENSQEFYAQKLGLAQADPPTEAVENTEPEVEAQGSEPEAEKEEKQEERKQNPKLERRFSEITKQREEARKEAQREREAREALETRLAALEKQTTQKVDEEPQPSQFQDAFEYAKALAEYTADRRIEEMKREEAQAKVEAQRQEVIKTWAKKVESAKAELPDFDDMVASSDVVVSDAVRDAILESDVGPKILYHLAENSELAQKISGMSERQALRELGKLEARFEQPVEAKPVQRSNAPKPVQPLKAISGVAETKLDSNGQWYGSYAEWKQARKAGKVR